MTPERAKELLPVIQAFAEGTAIQVQVPDGTWLDLEVPTFGGDTKYRIKPETLKYRVALMKDSQGVFLATLTEPASEEKVQKGSPFFVRWLTDWIEVEV